MKEKIDIIDLQERIIKKYIESVRPPIDIRDQVDVGYSFENRVVELFEIRPQFNDVTKIHQYPFARAKYIKSKAVWKVYWIRASGKWAPYNPAEIQSLHDFVNLVKEDTHGCFGG